MGSDLFFQPMAEQQMPTAGLEGVYRNDYPDHSYYRIARGIQRRRQIGGDGKYSRKTANFSLSRKTQ